MGCNLVFMILLGKNASAFISVLLGWTNSASTTNVSGELECLQRILECLEVLEYVYQVS